MPLIEWWLNPLIEGRGVLLRILGEEAAPEAAIGGDPSSRRLRTVWQK